jgi:cation-transporting ATPase E
MAFAVGVIRLGRRRCLVKQLAGVEALARVDVICVDKTGTLTSGDMHLADVEPLAHEGDQELRFALAAIATSDPSPNATMKALAGAVDEPPRSEVVERRPFSSARKWSAVAFRDRGWFLLGAPEMLLPPAAPELRREAAEILREHRLSDAITSQCGSMGHRIVCGCLEMPYQPGIAFLISGDPSYPHSFQ